MVVMDVFTRRIIGFGVERADPCGASICRMFNQIIAAKSLPGHLSSDHDPYMVSIVGSPICAYLRSSSAVAPSGFTGVCCETKSGSKEFLEPNSRRIERG